MKKKCSPLIKSCSYLLKKNKDLSNIYKKNSKLLKLIRSKKMEQKHNRQKFLDAVQVFSDYFQKVVLLRSALCDSPETLEIANLHLQEEFGHNLALMKDRSYRPKIWDPILEASSAWFCWKMFTADDDEKTLIVHLVLETSANIFFQEAHKIMAKHKETDYFKIHSEADEKHEKMGISLLKHLSEKKYSRMHELLFQSWGILNVACDRIAELTLQS